MVWILLFSAASVCWIAIIKLVKPRQPVSNRRWRDVFKYLSLGCCSPLTKEPVPHCPKVWFTFKFKASTGYSCQLDKILGNAWQLFCNFLIGFPSSIIKYRKLLKWPSQFRFYFGYMIKLMVMFLGYQFRLSLQLNFTEKNSHGVKSKDLVGLPMRVHLEI